MANQKGREKVYPTTHHFQNSPVHSVNTSVFINFSECISWDSRQNRKFWECCKHVFLYIGR